MPTMEKPPENLGPSLEGNNWVLKTGLEYLESAEIAFEKKLREALWSENEIIDLSLGFRECVVNAMAHGNLAIDKAEGGTLDKLMQRELQRNPEKVNKKVKIDLDIAKDRVYIRVQDEGKGFKRIPKLSDPTLPESLMKTQGRGLFLMEHYYDSVEIVGIGNEIILSKERKSA